MAASRRWSGLRTTRPTTSSSGSGLSLHIPSWHAVLFDPGESDHRPFQSSDVGIAFAEFSAARHSHDSRNPFHAGLDISRLYGSHFAAAYQVARPPARI